jgi:hypothetical protein
MSKTKYLIGGAAVIAALALTPLYVSSRVDARLNETQKMLESHGLKQEILSKSGYLTGTRTFSLEVSDAKKARDFMLEILVAKNPQYTLFAQSLQAQTDSDINEALDGLSFQGVIVSSHLLPKDIYVSLALAKLPKAIETELNNEPNAAKVILPLIAKGTLAFEMTFDIDQKLKSLKMKDIKESLQLEEGTLDIDTSGHTLSLDEHSGVVQGAFGIQKQNLGVKAPDFEVESHLENLRYTFDYKDDFNNKGDLSLSSYRFLAKEPYSDVVFSLGGMNIASQAQEVNKQINVKADYALKDIAFASSGEDAKLETLTAMLALKGIEGTAIKKLQNDYNAMVLSGENANEQALIDDITALIRNGLQLDFNVALKRLSGMLTLKDVGLDTKVEIAKNDFNNRQSPLAVIGLLDISSKLKMHKDDRATLEALNLTAPADFELGRLEGDFYVYDIAFKKGVLSVNGQAVQ